MCVCMESLSAVQYNTTQVYTKLFTGCILGLKEKWHMEVNYVNAALFASNGDSSLARQLTMA